MMRCGEIKGAVIWDGGEVWCVEGGGNVVRILRV